MSDIYTIRELPAVEYLKDISREAYNCSEDFTISQTVSFGNRYCDKSIYIAPASFELAVESSGNFRIYKLTDVTVVQIKDFGWLVVEGNVNNRVVVTNIPYFNIKNLHMSFIEYDTAGKLFYFRTTMPEEGAQLKFYTRKNWKNICIYLILSLQKRTNWLNPWISPDLESEYIKKEALVLKEFLIQEINNIPFEVETFGENKII